MPITSRERVKISLQHKEPDRVPLALGGGPYGIVDEVYFKLVDMFDLGGHIPPFRIWMTGSLKNLEQISVMFTQIYCQTAP